MNRVILDASALLALIKEESGADQVEKLLGSICMSSINVSEVAAILLKSEITFEQMKDAILPLISIIVSFDETQALQTAELKKKTKSKGLSLGDRACIALGLHLKMPIYTADKMWASLDLEQADIRLIR